jgi:hypothetical protein
MDLIVDTTAATRLLETGKKTPPEDIRTVVKFHEPRFLKKELAWICTHGCQENGEKSNNRIPPKPLAH